ncbi:hypothetical protein [Cohaesibacter celericrescens]|uniref:Holin n=1 Tax=Cohaesibacter celericrescens TaxID=2067669 RepID=A0A2N5XQJ6_9HYPH|nr:hypothetical protein [Cohaesibacter celericrescens]PLW76791.1 hypothetical protein C0081_12065 [Cohaesibacter celericrescens]
MTLSNFSKMKACLILGSLAFVALAIPANAATIDLSPLSTLAGDVVQGLAEIIAAILVGTLAWAGKKLFGLQLDAKQRESLHGAIERGIGSGLEVMVKKVDGKTSFDVDSEVVALVANYVVKMSPDAVRYFGLTPDKLADLIKAKFGEKLLVEMDMSAQAGA